MAATASRSAIRRLIYAAQHTACPCHGCRTGGVHNSLQAIKQIRQLATPTGAPPIEKEYAFEVGECLHVDRVNECEHEHDVWV